MVQSKCTGYYDIANSARMHIAAGTTITEVDVRWRNMESQHKDQGKYTAQGAVYDPLDRLVRDYLFLAPEKFLSFST
jgi:hypothetical protein